MSLYSFERFVSLSAGLVAHSVKRANCKPAARECSSLIAVHGEILRQLRRPKVAPCFDGGVGVPLRDDGAILISLTANPRAKSIAKLLERRLVHAVGSFCQNGFLTGQSDHRRHATMRGAFVHLQLFFCKDHILETGECLFQHGPRVELVELFRSSCPIGELLRGVTLDDKKATRLQRFAHTGPLQRPLSGVENCVKISHTTS